MGRWTKALFQEPGIDLGHGEVVEQRLREIEEGLRQRGAVAGHHAYPPGALGDEEAAGAVIGGSDAGWFAQALGHTDERECSRARNAPTWLRYLGAGDWQVLTYSRGRRTESSQHNKTSRHK